MDEFWEAVGAFIGAIMSLVSIPLFFLNMFGGIVAGIWLMVLGRWGEFGLGIFILFAGTFLLGIVLLPAFFCQATGMALFSRRKPVSGSVMTLLGGIWTYFVVYVWCCATFTTMVEDPRGHMIPLALWGYANAVGPWGYMASKGGKDETGSMIVTFAAQLGCVAMMIGVLFRGAPTTVAGLAPYLAPFMLFGFLAQLVLAVAMVVEARSKRVDVFA